MRSPMMFLISGLLLVSSSQAATYIVTPDGTGDFPSILSAIAAVAFAASSSVIT